MIPTPGAEFLLRLNTNEMIERERLAALLAAIEVSIRRSASAPDAYLLVGAVRSGSVEIYLGTARSG